MASATASTAARWSSTPAPDASTTGRQPPSTVRPFASEGGGSAATWPHGRIGSHGGGGCSGGVRRRRGRRFTERRDRRQGLLLAEQVRVVDVPLRAGHDQRALGQQRPVAEHDL